MSKRSTDNVKHHDFLQLMIDAKKQKGITESINESENKTQDSESHHSYNEKVNLISSKTKLELTDNDIVATGFIFFIAGYETTASLLSFLFYELTLNQEIQQKTHLLQA